MSNNDEHLIQVTTKISRKVKAGIQSALSKKRRKEEGESSKHDQHLPSSNSYTTTALTVGILIVGGVAGYALYNQQKQQPYSQPTLSRFEMQ